MMRRWEQLSGEEHNAICEMLFGVISFKMSVFIEEVLNIYLGDSRRSISDFGCSEVEIVLAVFLKLMWRNAPSAVCSMFFEKLGQPSRRSLKLLASLVQCMKMNNSTDFSIPSSMQKECMDAYFNEGFKQVRSPHCPSLMRRLPSG